MTRPNRILLVAACLLCCATLPGQEKTYVGAETCSVCHPDHMEWFQSSAHGKAAVTVAGGEEVTGCEACHGPGSAHAESMDAALIHSFRKEPSKERIDACLACHGERHGELNYRRSAHMRRGVSCTDCHVATGSEGFHKMRAVDDVMRGVQPKLCYECHTEQRGAFLLPYHHPVEEKFMGCTDCHDPHGAYRLTQLRSRHTEARCTSCHENTGGPFIFEHPPGRASGCTACHQPHGSTNPRMLNRAQVQYLCLECHTNTPAFHDLTDSTFRNCTVCHSKVHGSNMNKKLME